MSQIELKPCPFCGADEASPYLGEPGPGVIKCWAADCGAEMNGFETDEEAAEAWNRSAQTTEVLVKALETVRANLIRLAWEENSVMIEGIDKALATAREAGR